MNKKVLFILLLLLPFGLFGESTSPFSILVTPGVEYPFETVPKYFTIGGGVGMNAGYRLPFFPLLGVRGELGFSYMPIWSGDGCNLLTAGGGMSINFPKLGKLTSSIFGSGGYYYGIIADNENASGGNIYFSGGGRIGWSITPSFNLGIEANYKWLSDGSGGALFNGLSLGISNSYSFLSTTRIKIENIKYIDIFPVLYKFYDTNSIGTVTVQNVGEVPVKDMEVTVYVDKYMDNPTNCPAPKILKGGEKAKINLYALFAEKVLNITETTIVSGKVSVSYTQKNKKHTVERSESIRLYDRHAMVWDDNRKAAAYVTNKDPVVLDIAKSIAHMVKETGRTVDINLATAMAVHEALGVYGITYVVDPTTPFIEFSKNKMAVDFIQFPRNTLHFKSGDCDDLSILYSAILQAVGIDTAFITIPGHIYMAFALKLPPSEAEKMLHDRGDIILKNDRAWVPVEITRVGSSFLEAWKTGALEWKENSLKNAAQFYPMYNSWKVYEPVGYIDESAKISFAPIDKIEKAYKKEMNRFINRELYSRVTYFEDKLKKSPTKYSILNKLGTVYARYGRIDKAKEYFTRVIREREYFPSVLNLGNVYYMEGNLQKALSYYEKAQKLKPANSVVLLQLSRLQNELGNFDESASYYKKLKQKNPKLAARFSYLDISAAGTSRASESAGKEIMLWEE